jgi:type II secretory pathway component PulF
VSALNFHYEAVDRSGAKRKGVTVASTKAEAFRKVAALGLTPLSIREARSGAGSSRAPGLLRSDRIPTKDLAHFTYQLGVLVSARIPISDGLVSVAQQEKEGKLKSVIMDLAKRIQAGEQVAGAMDSHRHALGEVYVETIRAAEKSGNLPRVLEHLSEMLEKSQETTRQVRGALMYPICVVGVLALAVVFLLAFVVPKFAKMFAQRNLELPVFTRILMQAGDSMQNYWWAYFGALGLVALALRFAWLRPRGQAAIDRALHRVPYLKDILVGVTVSRFCSIFSLSLSSGLGLIESLELAGKAAGRPSLSRDVSRMIAQVRSGGRLMDVLSVCTYLTPFTKRMLIAGEQSAEIPKMCGVVTRHYERETGHLTKNLSTVIEPVLIVGIAGIVLVIALAIFLPMWDMAKIVG